MGLRSTTQNFFVFSIFTLSRPVFLADSKNVNFIALRPPSGPWWAPEVGDPPKIANLRENRNFLPKHLFLKVRRRVIHRSKERKKLNRTVCSTPLQVHLGPHTGHRHFWPKFTALRNRSVAKNSATLPTPKIRFLESTAQGAFDRYQTRPKKVVQPVQI